MPGINQLVLRRRGSSPRKNKRDSSKIFIIADLASKKFNTESKL
jgi:hypothetical protein